jgi:chromosome segregation ATPase
LRESLANESERAGENIGTLLARLTSGNAQMRELGSSAGDVLTNLQKAVSSQADELNQSMDKICERQNVLSKALDQQRETINALLARLTLAQDETATTAERTASRLNDGVQQIARGAETLDSRAGFAREVEEIEKQALHAEQHSRLISAAATDMHEKISGLRSSLREEGDMTNAALGSLLEKITTGASDIRDLSASTEISLSSLGNNVTQQSAALTFAMEQIGERQQTLASALEAQREVINGLLNRLTLAQDETAVSADRTAARLTDGAQKIAQQVESIDARTLSALASVQSATQAFAKEAEAIDVQAKHVEQQAQAILASASGLHGQIYDLRTSMQFDGERTAEALTGILTRVATGSSEIREAGSAAEKTLTSLHSVIGTQAAEIKDSMQKIAERQQVLTT